MAVIHPSLFLVINRFPDHKAALRDMYRTSDTFQGICHNYKKCSEALDYWCESRHAEAPNRQREYSELLKELEQEIIQSLEERL
jgi:hypothetical protein